MFAAHNLRYDDSYPTMPARNRNTCSRRYVLSSAGVLALLFFAILTFGRSIPAPRQLRWRSDLSDDIANSTLGFQKIFAVNLPSRTDKRDSMSLAAALTGLDIEFIAGVTEVDPKVLPSGGADSGRSAGEIGAWRAHMNALQRVVEQNLSSAFIFEDDTDWDIRIRSQMRDFAIGSRMLLQPMSGNSKRHLHPTYHQGLSDAQQLFDLDPQHLDRTTKPTTSPYGDLSRWDVFWLGHCGARFPAATHNLPHNRVVFRNDPTVPEQHHLDPTYGDQQLLDQYPDHTRVVSHAHGNLCTLGYAVSQAGARKLLYQLGLHQFTGPTDLMFQQFCDGIDGSLNATCLTIQPQIFAQYRPSGDKSGYSDISGVWQGINKVAYTRNIRWSTSQNFAKLLSGNTDYVDIYKDGAERIDLGGFGPSR